MAESAVPQRLTLQVPESVDLAKMSNAEIEKLAIQLSQKAAAAVGAGHTLLGVDSVRLVGGGRSVEARPDIAISIGWSRACGLLDVQREGLAIDPTAFNIDDVGAKTTIERST